MLYTPTRAKQIPETIAMNWLVITFVKMRIANVNNIAPKTSFTTIKETFLYLIAK